MNKIFTVTFIPMAAASTFAQAFRILKRRLENAEPTPQNIKFHPLKKIE